MKSPGHLKIFLGMCPGVGKTYAMLQDARARRSEGVDVLIGCVDVHGRPETAALAAGLPALAAFDVEAVLARAPELVVVDDLSQHNAPGARHPKRYQDVQELLDAGIDVYAALDVQHFESRADAAAQIIGGPVGETVPDSVLERTAEIELIDLAPDDLLRRLAEGKVHLGAVPPSYFRKGNLTALREMALRVTAEHVDRQMRDYMRVKHIAGPWKPSERLMVAVNDSALSERLIRHTRRLAYALEAFWQAVHVETATPLDARARAGVERNLALARELGAEVLITTDADVARGLLRVAQQHNITRILVGRSRMSPLRRLFGGGSLAARLIDQSGRVDVHVVGGEDLGHAPSRWFRMQFHSSVAEYAKALGTMLAVVVAGDVLFPLVDLDYPVMSMVFLFSIVLLALRFARGPVLAATALSAAALDFIFITPYYTFKIERFGDLVLFALYFGIAAVVGMLTARIRDAAVLLRQSEAQAVASFDFASALSRAVTMDDVCRATIERLSRIFEAPVRILLPDANGRLHLAVSEVDEPAPASELGVAAWAFDHGQPAGRFTETLPTASSMHVPLLTAHGAVGVVSIALSAQLATTQSELLSGLVSQVALAVEREQLAEAAQQSSVLKESERLSKTLLNLISHELRTPITAIAGAASSLVEPQIDRDPVVRGQLHHSIRASAARLDKLIENLLDMTRLESGTLRLNSDWTDVSDLVHTVRERVADELAGHDFIVEVEPDLPLLKMDTVLMEQVVYNLLHNAAMYTPKGTRVRLRAQCEGGELLLTVMDRGPGLPRDEVARAFDKFHRVNQQASTGLGLGLSICKGLVEAHGGAIAVENRSNGGLRVTIRLPIEPVPEIPDGHDE